ncbi:MAG TPA: selenocysteine-specific translation elongation factor [Gemmatimonadaceae bacterium]
MILGTAGHIDHGKTALVRALTGVDTDRLPEEKKRGITIDLGFAPLTLDNGGVIGVVDVPGHEGFVRTMVAGATGIDLALLVIAADEGPMPQTREHLAILEILDVPRLIVVLAKRDLVDADWLALVTEDVKTLLKTTPYASSTIIPTSVVSSDGLVELKQAIATAAESRKPRAESDLFRLPVDRAFSVKGTGTVVTGTVWSGSLSIDDTVRIMPLGVSARVRGLHNHGAPVKRIAPGMRAAIALAGVEPQAAARGATIVTHAGWDATMIVRADVAMLPEAPELRPRTKVRFHLATSDVGARVVAAGSPVAPGSSRTVRIALDEPMMVRTGDRFVLRTASPLATIGGGVVTDSNAPRRARPMPSLALSTTERAALFIAESGTQGLALGALPVRLGVPASDKSAASANGASVVGDRLYDKSVVEAVRRNVSALVGAYHVEHPLDPGAPRQDIRSRLKLDATLFDDVVARMVKDGEMVVVGASLKDAAFKPELSKQEQGIGDQIIAALDAAGAEPPSLAELEAKFGKGTSGVLRHLERQKLVVRVEDTRYYAPAALRALVGKLEALMAGKGELAPTDLREGLGFSRKFLIPFLEYCDGEGLTARQGNGRVWRGSKTT